MNNMKETTKMKKNPPRAKKSDTRSCKNCVKGKATGFSKEILCWEKGIVSDNYRCSAHRYFVVDDINKRDFFRCSDCEFFVFHHHELISSYGVCDMFSVRKCDGSKKKACSKFIKRKEQTA